MSAPRSALGLSALLLLAVFSGCTTVAPRATPPTRFAASEATFVHDDFDAFLKRHVDAKGRVDYGAAAQDRADLDRYVAEVAAVSPDSHPARFPDSDHRLAYWINAYNAWAITLVLEHYPITSVKEVRPPRVLFFLPRVAGFFFFRRVTLGGKKVTLYGLENQVVRKRFADPRIHFALNCASIGCPRLPARAFRGASLQQELEDEARFFVSEERNVGIETNGSGRVLRLSSIFDWYESDFSDWMEEQHPGDDSSLRAYVLRYLAPEKAEALGGCGECPVAFIPYDWGLNDRPASGVAITEGD